MLDDSPIVVLFDVDGTLLRTEGASRHSRAFKAAFRQVYGTDCRFTTSMHGMTDLQIFLALAREMGLEDGQPGPRAQDACRSMVEIYRTPCESDGSYVALPGVARALETLAGRGVVLGLLTGNAPEIAADKLAAIGLEGYFRFGAFGTEAGHRSDLPPLAISRAESMVGSPIDRRRVFVIGDTPRDVACALDNGCRAVAVATGNFGVADLLATGAELVLPNLLDLVSLLEHLGLETSAQASGA